jgi:hypothetical protein
MAIEKMIAHEKSAILVLLVTCSRDESRRDMAIATMKNLQTKIPEADLQNSFFIFDNDSTFRDHLAYAPMGTTIIESPENVGYWSAIDWVMNHAEQIKGKKFKYIYCIESDLTHWSLRPLESCATFLDQHSDINCIRTQEFSVRSRWRFNKAYRFLPFRVKRSLISMKDWVTGQDAWFQRTDQSNIWLSNLHAKVPAFNRITAMKQALNDLKALPKFGENDFFTAMHKLTPTIGILDGGLYYQGSTAMSKNIMSGSWSSPKDLAAKGYMETRKSSFVQVPQNLKIDMISDPKRAAA